MNIAQRLGRHSTKANPWATRYFKNLKVMLFVFEGLIKKYSITFSVFVNDAFPPR